MNEPYHQVGGIKITWHAIARYLERFLDEDDTISEIRSKRADMSDYDVVKEFERMRNIDIQSVCDSFITNDLWSKMFVSGMMDGAYEHGDCRVILKNKHVLTLMPAKSRQK